MERLYENILKPKSSSPLPLLCFGAYSSVRKAETGEAMMQRLFALVLAFGGFSVAEEHKPSVNPNIHLANIIRGLDDDPNDPLPDGRRALSEIAITEGIPQDQVDQIRQSTGGVFCPGRDAASTEQGSAALAGSDDQVIISRHVYEAVIQKQGVDGLSRCLFQNQEKDCKIANLDFSSPGKFIVGDPTDIRNDFVVVKLKPPTTVNPCTKLKSLAGVNPFRGVIPLAFARRADGVSALALSIGADGKAVPQKIIKISAREANTRYKITNTEPTATACYARSVYPSDGNHPSVIQSDCDASPGGSGGVNLVWSWAGSQRRLVIAGFTERAANPEKDGQAYSKDTYTYSVGADGALMRAIRKLAEQRSPE